MNGRLYESIRSHDQFSEEAVGDILDHQSLEKGVQALVFTCGSVLSRKW